MESIILCKFLADDVWEKIGRRGSVEAAAKEAGVSVSTLGKILKEGMPSLETFALLCKWMKRSPGNYFDLGNLADEG